MKLSLADLGHQFALSGGLYCMQCGRGVRDLAMQPRRCLAPGAPGVPISAETEAERAERIWQAVQDMGRGA